MGLIKLHNKQQFNINLYSYGNNDRTLYRDKLQSYCNNFIDISKKSAMQAANSIAKDNIDILVDLKGHTKGNRLEICALRPAPIQVSYLGFLGTTGATFIDY